MEQEDKLYFLIQELNRAKRKGFISHDAMEQVLAPLAGMNEKRQDAYAEEMISVMRTSADEAEVLARIPMCVQLVSEGALMDQSERPGKKQRNAAENRNTDGRENHPETKRRNTVAVKCTNGRADCLENIQGIDADAENDTDIYLYRFTLPVAREEELLRAQMEYNGGSLGYLDNPYPCGIFDRKELEEITFSNITIFYGGNGSGKSTLLNLIANRLEMNRVAPYNSGELFDRYRDACAYTLGHDEEGFALRIPSGSRIITSDDVFDYMLTLRTHNDEVSGDKEKARENYWKIKKDGAKVKFRGMEDYEMLRQQVMAWSRTCSRRTFIKKTAGEEIRLGSNGETALTYFQSKIKSKTLYCLDEPENSLSPALQLELVKLLEKRAYEEECQLILATHSPFLLAMSGAKVYDLDACPARVCPWWELENVRIYHAFFEKHRERFL